MKYKISKNKNRYKSLDRISFEGGYGINKKIRITIYNDSMINSIINSIVKTKLNKISVLNMLYENNDDDEGTGKLIQIKIEELRHILLGEYKEYISNKKMQKILKDLKEIESRYKVNKRSKTKWQEATEKCHFFFYINYGDNYGYIYRCNYNN